MKKANKYCILFIIVVFISCTIHDGKELKTLDLRKSFELNGADLLKIIKEVEINTIAKNGRIIGKINKVLRDGEKFFFLTGEQFKSILITDANYKIQNLI